jgi:hypothetical protein
MQKKSEIGDTSEIAALVNKHFKEIETAEQSFDSELKNLRIKQRNEYHDFVMNFYQIEHQKLPSSPSLRTSWLSTPERSPALDRSTSTTPTSTPSLRKSTKNRMSFFRRKSKHVESQTLIGQSDNSKLYHFIINYSKISAYEHLPSQFPKRRQKSALRLFLFN